MLWISSIGKKKQLYQKLIFVLLFPILLFQHLSIPCVEEGKFNRFFLVLQPIGGAFFVSLFFGDFDIYIFGVHLWVLILIVGFFVSIILFIFTRNGEPKFFFIFTYIALFMSVLWIYASASELVALLESIGIMLGISNSIMGLTVLAYGNSIADLISNSMIARQGYPGMSLGAVYAAPLCNTLLGLGIALTIKIISTGSDYYLTDKSFLPNTTFFAIITLLITLLFTVIVVPMNRFVFKKPLVIVFLTIYVAFSLLSLFSEFGVLLPKTNLFFFWHKLIYFKEVPLLTSKWVCF